MTLLLLVLAALLGHLALHLVIYNRVNATGMPRKTIKRFSKLLKLSCVLLPIFVYLSNRHVDWLHPTWSELVYLHPTVLVYAGVCLAIVPLFGIPWLLWRPIFGLEWIDARRKIHSVDVATILDKPLALSPKCRIYSQIPGNQIFKLAIEEIDLPVRGLPRTLDGLKISHLSDVHFTGDVSPAYLNHVVEKSNDWNPDMCVVTGDIVDAEPCIQWLAPAFTPAIARFGKYFILGNHDLRVSDSMLVRQGMQQAGWKDVGGRIESLSIQTESIELIGNEYPWFPAPTIPETNDDALYPFRILLSHSPDRIWWARKRGIGLMLAGHTHGGQGRLPLAGPLLSPSWHGSRFASGDFYKSPTTMHVSRGLGGVHLIRLRCMPELSLLTLRAIR
jgi:predicted MPP superfamily phosphohydrolase